VQFNVRFVTVLLNPNEMIPRGMAYEVYNNYGSLYLLTQQKMAGYGLGNNWWLKADEVFVPEC